MQLNEIAKSLAPKNLLNGSLKELNGENGTNRCRTRTCQVAALNDLEAVECWLNEYKDKNSTFRAYQKESERLLLWCLVEQKKPLSSLNRQDFEDYMTFLQNPSPTEIWCGPKGSKARKRHEPAWRPFVGPLSFSAQMMSMAIIDSMLQFMVAASYLDFNPLSLMRRKKSQLYRQRANALKLHERILDDQDWQLILQTLKEMPEADSRQCDEKARLRFLIAILFLLGLRINELETHTWSSFKKINDKWWFFVVGKGDKPGKIPVNNELMKEVICFRRHLHLADFPEHEEEGPLIPSWHKRKALSSRQMSNLVKNLALSAAAKVDEPARKEKLKSFSPHWVRHLSASVQDRSGIRFAHIKANHRHESDETTRRYVHAIDNERHEDMEKLKLF